MIKSFIINFVMTIFFVALAYAAGACIALIINIIFFSDRSEQIEKVDVEKEAAYYKRAKKLVFTELKEKLGVTMDKTPQISICPIHDCCIMQSKYKDNLWEMIHYQF